MRILSIDTTADICSISLADGESSFNFHEIRPREHAKILLPEIEKLLIQAALSIQDLDYVAYGRGPGSFTGIRIAAGVAQGLALAADCPIIPISTLQSLAFTATSRGATDIWVAIDARMSEIYFARYQVNDQGLPMLIGEEKVIAPALLTELPPTTATLVGNGWSAGYAMPDAFADAIANAASDILLPAAKDSLALANILLQHDATVAVAPELALPIYLRDNVTWDKKPKVGS